MLPQTFPVYIRNCLKNTQKIEIEVAKTETVGSLKAKVAEEMWIPKDKFNLNFAGVWL